MEPIAVFWDQSFLWGLILCDTLSLWGIPFDVLNAEAVRRGKLEYYKVVIVPGGWAAQKLTSLGEPGGKAVRQFVERGGNYLGFCGGGGLALSGPQTLNMVPLERLPLQKRLPSASGTVTIRLQKNHPLCDSLPARITTSVWWPSQFSSPLSEGVACIAHYDELGEDFWVSDLPLRGITSFEELEKIYGINLNPYRCFINHPAIAEYKYGKGTVVVSYPHLETPGDREGHLFFIKILEYLAGDIRSGKVDKVTFRQPELPSINDAAKVKDLFLKVRAFIEVGSGYGLWLWRKPWILGWKRGVRGLEYSMLKTCLQFLMESFEVFCNLSQKGSKRDTSWSGLLSRLGDKMDEFLDKAGKLIEEERLLTLEGPLSKLGEVNESIDKMRFYLFGSKMNHGGLCKEIFDLLDVLLYETIMLLKAQNRAIRLQREEHRLVNFSA